MLSGGSPGSAESTLAPSTTGTSVPAGQGAGVPVWLLIYTWRPSEPATRSHIVVFYHTLTACKVPEHGYGRPGRLQSRYRRPGLGGKVLCAD